MNIPKLIAIAALALTACGNSTAATDGLVYDADGRLLERLEPSSEIGQARQSLMGAPMGNMQLGFDIWRNERTCVPGDEFQDCTIPRKESLRYWVLGDTFESKANTEGLTVAFHKAFVGRGLDVKKGWALSKATGTDDTALTLILSADRVAGCPGTGTAGMSCFTGSIHGIEAVGVAGNYSTWNGVPVLHIDYDEIMNDSTLTQNQKNNLLIHAVWSGLLRFMGIGLQDVSDRRCNSSVRLKNDTCLLRAEHACAANGFGDVGNQTQFWLGGAKCGN